MPQTAEHLTITRHGHVAELALDRPGAMNAVSTGLARQLAAACEELARDQDVRVTVLTSTHPKAFCVGADLKERNRFTDAELVRQRPTARAAYTGVLELPMPTIAAVHGYALGGGYELALACDLIVADPTAVVGLPEVSVPFCTSVAAADPCRGELGGRGSSKAVTADEHRRRRT
ncbi:enoyl-CoA hydratase/isomerase family protein [Streptomyces albidoflavus]|uniref:enoyl-CoA hydratase/isomerase family protein n=1 Tax=Streptomyces albidoflavus TaxID=1886 RepID=UPI00211CFE3A|nr:enoyl-CoA hydratase/isomerase family protein [Streptomyces albidoflavus]